MELYERVPIEAVNGLTFVRGLGAFLLVCAFSLIVWVVNRRAQENRGAELANINYDYSNQDVAYSDADDYIDKIEDFQDDFR